MNVRAVNEHPHSIKAYRVGAFFDGTRFRTGEFVLCIKAGRVADLCEEREWLRERRGPAGGDFIPVGLPSSNFVDESAQDVVASDAFKGKVLVPFFADAHIHSFLDPWPIEPAARRPDPAGVGVRALRRVQSAPRSGLALLRDGGDPSGINLAVKRRLLGSEPIGNESPGGEPFSAAPPDDEPVPRFLVPGPALHAPGRYGSFLGEAVGDRREIVRAVDRLAAEGVDFIKVLATGIVDFRTGEVKGKPQFSEDDLRYLVDVCHERGLRVMAHASGREGVAQCVAAGVDTLEHGYLVDRPTLERMAERNIAWTPTFAPVWVQFAHHRACGWGEAERGVLKGLLAGHSRSLRLALELGVNVLTGSDAGAPGVDQTGGIYLELELMQDAGMGVEALLEASCARTPATLTGAAPTFFEKGSPARFVVAPERALRDVRGLLDAECIVWDGRLLPFTRPRVHGADGGGT